MSRIALISLVALTVAFSAVCRADNSAVVTDPPATADPAAPVSDAAVEPSASAAATPAASRHRPATHLTVAQSIDENVRRLARALDLDPGQQAKLRQILVEQHRQMLQLRSGGSAGSGDATGTAMAIYGQTKGRIRAMLNDEQKIKYSADVPRDTLAPAKADLQHWMQMQESSRKQGDEASQ
jgi:hypothetical protein